MSSLSRIEKQLVIRALSFYTVPGRAMDGVDVVLGQAQRRLMRELCPDETLEERDTVPFERVQDDWYQGLEDLTAAHMDRRG